MSLITYCLIIMLSHGQILSLILGIVISNDLKGKEECCKKISHFNGYINALISIYDELCHECVSKAVP